MNNRFIIFFFFAVIIAFALHQIFNDDQQQLENEILPTIWWHAPLLSSTGFGSESRAIVLGLHKTKRSQLICTQHGDSVNAELLIGLRSSLEAVLTHCFGESEQLAKMNAGKTGRRIVTVCHSEPGAWHVLEGQLYDPVNRCPPATSRSAGRNRFYLVGRTMFETANVTVGHRKRLRAMDELWVPSQWQRDVFIDQAQVDADKIFVVPEPVDSTHFDPSKLMRPRRTNAQLRCKFLSIHKWEQRKGWALLIEAFARHFAFDERVHLTIKTKPPRDFNLLEWMRAADALSDVDDEALVGAARRIVIDTDFVDDEVLPNYYAQFDAFVLASRGEGWGRGQAEAMAMAIPVVSTVWSGPSEFMNDRNSFGIELDANEPLRAIADGPFRRHLMANPSIASIGEQMRRVVDDPQEAARRGRQARIDMQTLYSPEAIADIIDARVAQIHHTV